MKCVHLQSQCPIVAPNIAWLLFIGYGLRLGGWEPDLLHPIQVFLEDKCIESGVVAGFLHFPYEWRFALQGMLAGRVLELLWGMVMAPDAHVDAVAAAIKGLRDALDTYVKSLDEAQVLRPTAALHAMCSESTLCSTVRFVIARWGIVCTRLRCLASMLCSCTMPHVHDIANSITTSGSTSSDTLQQL